MKTAVPLPLALFGILSAALFSTPGAEVVAKNVIVYYEPGRFAGWPANNGVWSWGNEIPVGFSRGYFKANEDGHSIDRGKVADIAGNNGNPPSLARLPGGRLCAAYGTRAEPYGIRAKVSADSGQTWGDEIVLRRDGRTWDLGYTRTVVRPDGKLVTIYYFTTTERPEPHIAATIWQPPAAR